MCQNLPRTTEKEPCVLTFRFSFGDIAQLVEQMTFNHWVQGSSPCVPTKNSTTACRSFNFCMGCGREPKKGSTMSKRAKPCAGFLFVCPTARRGVSTQLKREYKTEINSVGDYQSRLTVMQKWFGIVFVGGQ